jgi:hypothetical protein
MRSVGVLIFVCLLGLVSGELRAAFYGNVCSREEMACGVYPVTNITEHTLLQTFLSVEGPALKGYTIYISPFAVTCTPPYCWRPNPTTIDPGPRHIWNSPLLLVDIEGLSIKSAFPNVADPRVQIEHDEVTVQAAMSLTLGCSSFLISSSSVSVEDMLLSIDSGCSEWIEAKKETDVGDYAGVIVSAPDFGHVSFTNIELTGGLVTAIIVPTESVPEVAQGTSVTLNDVSLSSPLVSKGRVEAALLFRVMSENFTLTDKGSAPHPVLYLSQSTVYANGSSVAYNLSYSLPPNGMSLIDPEASVVQVFVTEQAVTRAIEAGVWTSCAILFIILVVIVVKWITKNNQVRRDHAGDVSKAKEWIHNRKQLVASNIMKTMDKEDTPTEYPQPSASKEGLKSRHKR